MPAKLVPHVRVLLAFLLASSIAGTTHTCLSNPPQGATNKMRDAHHTAVKSCSHSQLDGLALQKLRKSPPRVRKSRACKHKHRNDFVIDTNLFRKLGNGTMSVLLCDHETQSADEKKQDSEFRSAATEFVCINEPDIVDHKSPLTCMFRDAAKAPCKQGQRSRAILNNAKAVLCGDEHESMSQVNSSFSLGDDAKATCKLRRRARISALSNAATTLCEAVMCDDTHANTGQMNHSSISRDAAKATCNLKSIASINTASNAATTLCEGMPCDDTRASISQMNSGFSLGDARNVTSKLRRKMRKQKLKSRFSTSDDNDIESIGAGTRTRASQGVKLHKLCASA
jgi:hypothetical protein